MIDGLQKVWPTISLSLAGLLPVSPALAQDVVDRAPAEAVVYYSHLENCYRERSDDCRVRSILVEDLQIVNRLVWQNIADKPDPSPADPWIAFPRSRLGDCDDHTVTVRAALRTLGMPDEAMRIHMGYIWEADGRMVGHAVLGVMIDGREWILDRRTPDSVYLAEARPYSWRPIASQPDGRVIWERPNDERLPDYDSGSDDGFAELFDGAG